MAGAKETPRQRMIAMMYLVLTALLALNVSKEVIDAFLVVNESVELTNEKMIGKLKATYGTFEKMYQLNQSEVQSFWQRALTAKTLSENMVDYIINLRDELISNTEKIPLDSVKKTNIKDLRNKDNYSLTTAFLMGDSHDGSQGKARDLKNNIVNFKKTIIDLIHTDDQQNLKLGLVTDSIYYNADHQEQNWEAHHFYNTILAADITILNKMITEVYDTEFEIVTRLMNEINASDFSYDKIEAKVLPDNNYIFAGDVYEADVFVAAYDTSQSPEVYVLGGADTLPVEQLKGATLFKSNGGRTKLRLPNQNPGIHKYAGVISVKTSSGDTNYYHFKNQYIVANPSVTVSVEEMNVLYVGVENTVSISVSGIPKEKLIPKITNGTINKGLSGDKWIVSVQPEAKQSIISVSAIINNELKEMGRQTFRIKKLPDPFATIANKKSGFINREILIAAGAIVPKMPADFEYNLYFTIESFDLTIQRGFNTYNYSSNSGLLTDEMIEQIEITNRGQNLIFDHIIAAGPYGDKRALAPIILTIN